jgi:hypothetical protein
MRREKNCFFLCRCLKGHTKVQCGVTGGSGWVVVVPLDKGERGGSNGVKIIVCLWVLRWLGGSEDEA